MNRKNPQIAQKLTNLLEGRGATVSFDYTDGRNSVVALATVPTEQGEKVIASPAFPGTDDSWDDGENYLHAEDRGLTHICKVLSLV